jgi:hypothetical protein
VYVDYDPIVLSHARALLTGTSGRTAFIDSDLRDVGKIRSQAAETLDFTEPVALMMIAVLHLIPDDDDPWGVLSDYLQALPSGSYLVISHPASDVDSGDSEQAAQFYNERVASRVRRRSRSEMARFFGGRCGCLSLARAQGCAQCPMRGGGRRARCYVRCPPHAGRPWWRAAGPRRRPGPQ